MNNYIELYGNKYWYLEDDIQKSGNIHTYKHDLEYINSQLYIKGELCHREGGPAIEWSNGRKDYFQHGKHHRIGGPAIEYRNGHKEYWENGNKHRENGPAVEYSDGDIEYWLCGISYSKDEYDFQVKKIQSIFKNSRHIPSSYKENLDNLNDDLLDIFDVK